MTRCTRRQSETDIYHVMIRGIDGMNIFRDDDDRRFFLSFLNKKLNEGQGEIYAWCLMSNHVHLLLKIESEALSKLMQSLNTTYALYFNKRYGRRGHLFQDRFRSEPVEDEAYLLVAVRYIHQNPVKAFMVPDCRYRWSSYSEYTVRPLFCETGFVLGFFDGIAGFLAFHSHLAFEDRCLDIVLNMSDAEATRYAEKVLGPGKLETLADSKDTLDRDRCLSTLANCMIPMKQVAQISGVSYSTVRRVCGGGRQGGQRGQK